MPSLSRPDTVVSKEAGGPWERKRLRTSLEIERAGLALLAARGLDEVTVEQAAAAAGISDRTFFRYFRNVPDLLTAVPEREVARMCRMVAARPPEEDLLAAFQSVFEGSEDSPFDPDRDLKEDALRLWTDVARRDPERVSALSHAQATMAVAFTSVIGARMGVDDLAAGVFGAALAGVVWFVYLQFIESDQEKSLGAMLDEAFERLGELYQPRLSRR